MRKLKLAIETLRVESFETSETGAEGRGTVAAHMPRPGGPTHHQRHRDHRSLL